MKMIRINRKYIDEVKLTNKEFKEMNFLSVNIDNVIEQLDEDKEQ
jgi:hypothetical protein